MSNSTPQDCERCRAEGDVSTMSKFNTQTICMDCKDEEAAHPDYGKACAAEEADLKKTLAAGQPNFFKGIGLPDDLRKDMIDNLIIDDVYDDMLRGALYGINDGYWELLESMSDAAQCSTCAEPITGQMLEVRDIDERLDLCPRCAKFVLEHFSVTLRGYVASVAFTIEQIDKHLGVTPQPDQRVAKEDLLVVREVLLNLSRKYPEVLYDGILKDLDISDSMYELIVAKLGKLTDGPI